MAKNFLFVDPDGNYEEEAAYDALDHISTSTGVGDAGKPIILDGSGQIDASMLENAAGGLEVQFYTHATLPATLVEDIYYVVDISGGNATATIPETSASNDTARIVVQPTGNAGGNKITLTASGADQFNDPELGTDTVYEMDIATASFVFNNATDKLEVNDGYWATSQDVNFGNTTISGDLTVTGSYNGLPVATVAQAGLVSTVDQSFAGTKTFNNNVNVGNGANLSVASLPNVTNSHFTIDGSSYTGFISLDATSMSIGHNSGSRLLDFYVNESKVSELGSSGMNVYVSASSASSPITWRSNTGNTSAGTLGLRTTDSRTRQYMVFNNRASSTAYWFGNDGNFRGGGVTSISQTSAGDGGVIVGTQTSDSRIKSNIVDLDLGLATVMALQPKRYDKQAGSTTKHELGFLAQDVDILVPESVYDTKEPLSETDAESMVTPAEGQTILAMEYHQLIPVLTKAIQEQQAQIEALQDEIDALKNQ